MKRWPPAVSCLLVVLALVTGFGLGRVTLESCTALRDSYASVSRQIRTQAQTDIDEIDPQFVEEAYALVASRSDCFGSDEVDEITRLREVQSS